MKGRGTIKRVYKVVSGGVLAQALTSSWTNGGSVQVEAATDFSPSGGDGFFESEAFSYRTREINNSDNPATPDLLLGVIRSNPVAHAKGTFVQEGETETVEKQCDIEVGGKLLTGIPIDSSVYTLYKLDTFTEDEQGVVDIEFDEEGGARVVSGFLGAVPLVGSDPETLPPVTDFPAPDPAGKKPATPTGFNAVARNVALPDGTFVYFVDGSYAHSGLYDDGSTVTGLHFRADFYDGATKRFVVEAGPSLSFTQQVEGNKTYDIQLFALDFANTPSTAATDSVSTTPDASAPATPTGLALLGGAGGGGVGIIYSQWTANTETDFDHYEVHASTSSGFTPSASTLVANTGATNHPISKAFNGSSMATFGYTTTVYVKLIAVDRSGNKSAASSQVSSTAAQAASADITDIQSDNYVLGVSGWRLTKAGNFEGNSGTFRGSLTAGTIVSLSSSGGGITITGSTNQIVLGSGLTLSGSGSGSITFGSGCTISGSSAGSINIGTGIIIDGTGTGTITGGKYRTSTGTIRVEIDASSFANQIRFFYTGQNPGYVQVGSLSLLLGAPWTSGQAALSLVSGSPNVVNIFDEARCDSYAPRSASVVKVTKPIKIADSGAFSGSPGVTNHGSNEPVPGTPTGTASRPDQWIKFQDNAGTDIWVPGWY